ncbi:FadR family transcriptional regulator [Cellulomonas sp. zg-ZUI222]|uniref:FadR family transcriptional regulator n=1 Tax=Cellulomonas wangleii TaxID=2816956 RepID=A0ABX8D2T7_9CELL|nr:MULTISPECIES: FadR/GntR family transcriptional regulator [Cellulomonas]MBO0899276.1 FadR family transcriptional regulator [Cellulomonas sp. zg-ZUI22]MBO0920127.1 FadR family transcriptional regulator [Cellulomonas wangleii]MBO0923444.1 FadR family transcriptional regulator [Cellulomonas wangleii]QVI61790.1 FadR family transcriptional regulator [Cellulomonas wangleii]
MSRTQDVVEDVQRLILDGVLRPGDRLPAEKELAAELGVSRGSLREGVRALVVLGILEARHGDGTYVTDLDAATLLAPLAFLADLPGDQGPLHAVRATLETEAAGLAALHMTDAHLARARAALDDTARALVATRADPARLAAADLAFHRAVADGSGNTVLSALLAALAGGHARRRVWDELHDLAGDRTFEDHDAILAAVAARDPDRARLRMAMHMVMVEDLLATASGDGPAPRRRAATTA